MNDTPIIGSGEWTDIDPAEKKKAIVEKFRELSDHVFHEWMVAHRTEKELTAMVMAIYLEILREEDLHLDREFMKTCLAITQQIHTACELQEKAERQAQMPETPTTTSNFRERFWRIFKRAA